MRRKFTVYGLRFFKTSFWNRINTGFPDPAVATVLTVYGIETMVQTKHYHIWHLMLQQYLPFTVLKHRNNTEALPVVRTPLLQQYLPFTVLKPFLTSALPDGSASKLQQYLPFTVLKLASIMIPFNVSPPVATVLTVYGIETTHNFSFYIS